MIKLGTPSAAVIRKQVVLEDCLRGPQHLRQTKFIVAIGAGDNETSVVSLKDHLGIVTDICPIAGELTSGNVPLMKILLFVPQNPSNHLGIARHRRFLHRFHFTRAFCCKTAPSDPR
jgi:hypothetical protein